MLTAQKALISHFLKRSNPTEKRAKGMNKEMTKKKKKLNEKKAT